MDELKFELNDYKAWLIITVVEFLMAYNATIEQAFFIFKDILDCDSIDVLEEYENNLIDSDESLEILLVKNKLEGSDIDEVLELKKKIKEENRINKEQQKAKIKLSER